MDVVKYPGKESMEYLDYICERAKKPWNSYLKKYEFKGPCPHKPDDMVKEQYKITRFLSDFPKELRGFPASSTYHALDEE